MVHLERFFIGVLVVVLVAIVAIFIIALAVVGIPFLLLLWPLSAIYDLGKDVIG
jgi:hypothetical protein